MNVKDFTTEELLSIIDWYGVAVTSMERQDMDEHDRSAILKLRVALSDNAREERAGAE